MSAAELSDFHVGDLIISFLKTSNIPQAHLARELSMATSNVNRLLKRDSMDTSLLLEISKKLNHNFFADISGDVQENKPFTFVSPQIGKHIEERLKELKMTQTQLAALMGCSQQYVSKVLKGQENLSLETMSKIEDCLEISILHDELEMV